MHSANDFPFPLVPHMYFGFQLLIPDPISMKEIYEREKFDFPYWSKIWPSALAMSEWIMQQPELIRGLNVMEIGAGIGLPSFVSSKYAKNIIVTDQQQNALDLINININLNHIQNMSSAKTDWQSDQIIPAEIYLLSDVNYEPGSIGSLQNMIVEIMNAGGKICLSTPQRITAIAFVEFLKPYVLMSYIRDADSTPISLYLLGKKG
ncbi:MAG: hypothetical protein ACO29O_00320 [Chitinophagaceae bacterium]